MCFLLFRAGLLRPISLHLFSGEVRVMKKRMHLLLAAVLSLSAPALATWMTPGPVSEINTAYHDKAPFLSFDGLTLYFSRQGGPGLNHTRIYQAMWSEPLAQFINVEEISDLNYSGGNVDDPWVSPDNLRMYYYRTEGSNRLKVTERASIDDPWQPGGNITEINALGNVANPVLTPDELTIIFSSTTSGGRGGYDLWMATRLDRGSPFGDAVILAQLNSTGNDAQASISPDGLTVWFHSSRNGAGQLFKGSRAALDKPFGNLEHLSLFDSPGNPVLYPSPSSDGTAFYFAKFVEGDHVDIYVSHIPEPATALLFGLGAVLLRMKRSCRAL